LGATDVWDVILRWFHIVAGIMWIGNSMLFNWLDRNLVKPAGSEQREGFQGEIWMVHSGGFYQVEKKLLAPGELPPELHWFKWQNFLTWFSGISLLVVVYYVDTSRYLVDPRVAQLSPGVAICLSLGVIVFSWGVYDVIWRLIGKVPVIPTLLSLGLVVGVTYFLCTTFSGRAAFIHVGVVLGTLMTGNVWTVILPSQKALIAATRSGQPQDVELGNRAKQRSIHNNYFTFPLLFIMVSNHFSAIYDAPRNWLLLLVLMAGGAGVRHLMNIRYGFQKTASPAARALAWLFPTAVIVSITLAVMSNMTERTGVAPAAALAAAPPATFAEVDALIAHRCRACHSATPTDPAWPAAPGGVKLDTPDEIQRWAPRIHERAVVLKTMPLINKTGMTDGERELLGRWVAQGASLR
jgi:uncharacterized membrane protein